jgi:hypothetical protein
MVGRDIPFIFYLVDTPTGLCHYRDAAGHLQQAPISASLPLNQKKAPDGWMKQKLGFMRSMTRFGMNRSYALPQKLIEDAAVIARTLMNSGRGIEVPLSMMVYKYNPSPAPGDPLYELYYKGQVDLPKYTNINGEGFQCNLMEGGFMQLLKAYENTIYSIPCDGSIPENIKLEMDGMLFEDVFNYSIIGIDGPTAGSAGLPSAFLSNEGDNAGIVHNDPSYDTIVGSPFSGDYYQRSQNYLFVSALPIKVRIQGSITIASSVPDKTINFGLFTATSKSVAAMTGGITNTIGLIPTEPNRSIPVKGQEVFNFDATIELDANERLFLMMSTLNGTDTNFSLKGGSFTLTFASQFPVTTPWCMTLFDLGRLLIQNICQDASINGQTFNYGFISQLLQDNLNLVATSGDALRASGDGNYQRFFNAVQNNPNFPNLNNYNSYGPTIRTSLPDFFDSVNAILNASMSTQIRSGENETVFIEKKGYVFNSSVRNLDNGEVSEFKDMVATDLYFTLLKIGYAEQQYDQKAGKYAWNTTAQWITPFKSIPSKTFEIICKYITEPYLIERLRSNIGDTSITRNSSDNSVFVINRDPSSFVYDEYNGTFKSLVPMPTNPGGTGNTNIHLQVNERLQSIDLQALTGAYFAYSKNASIFLFNQPGLAASTFNLGLSITGNLIGNPFNVATGQPADTATIKLWINGAVFQSWIITSSAASTPIAISLATTHAFSFKDSLYLTCDTSVTGTATLTAVTLTVSTGSPYLTATGSNIVITPGVAAQLLPLPIVTPALDGNSLPVISYGFQYFVFNSIVINSNFDIQFLLNGLMNGGPSGQQAGFDLYLNGVPVFSQSFTHTTGIQAFGLIPGFNAPTINHTFQLGDMIFMVASAQNVNVYLTDAVLQMTSTQIKAFKLKRIQYDAISGIPALLGYLPNTTIPITTGPGAPYNIDQLTPKQLLMTHGNYLRSIMFDQIPGLLTFSQLSKNQYLSFTKGGVTVTENASVPISNFEKQLFKPRYLTYKTRVQETFNTIMTGAANAYIGAAFSGVDIPGFPLEMTQEPALNEAQEWKLLAGPDLDLNTLNNIQIDGLKFLDMKPNSLYCSFLSPVQFVPEGKVLPVKYHTKSRNFFWFNEQVAGWINRNNYWQPWQTTDPCNLQFITRDLNAVTINVYDCSSATPLTSISATSKSSPAIVNPYFLWEVSVDLTAYAGKAIYLTAVAGSDPNTVTFISEGLWVKADWPGTLLIEPRSSGNKQSMIFDTGYAPAMRIRGFFDNMFEQKYKGAFYVNQPQDIQILNAISYEITELWSGLDDGEPDWVHKKVARMLLLDGTMIEGEGFSLDEGAEWEKTFIEGNPKKFHKINIRPARNLDGISQDVDGFTDDATMITTLDAQAMGPNAGNAGSTEPNIITVTINT